MHVRWSLFGDNETRLLQHVAEYPRCFRLLTATLRQPKTVRDFFRVPKHRAKTAGMSFACNAGWIFRSLAHMPKHTTSIGSFVAFLSALVFLAFVGGGFAVVAEVFPAGYLRDARNAGAEPIDGVDHLSRPVLEDFLVIVSSDGRTIRNVSLLDAVNRSKRYRQLLWQIPYYSLEDPLHVNSVKVIDEKSARALSGKVPDAKAGQVLLSFRELAGGSIALVDPDAGEMTWAIRGNWFAQHDADVLPNGNILLFDNWGNRQEGGRSRVVEVDLGHGGIVWSYRGSREHKLDSAIRSSQEVQPNGNILITESDGGRLLEVTRGGDIVWEYVNPVRVGKEVHRGKNGIKGQLIPIVSWGQRRPRGSGRTGKRPTRPPTDRPRGPLRRFVRTVEARTWEYSTYRRPSSNGWTRTWA